METQFWSKVKEFHGVQMLRDPETMQCRIVPIERPQPQKTAETVYSPEVIAATEKAVALYKMMNEAGERTRAVAMQPQPEQPKTPEEEWRTRPDIRAEFVSLTSYVAYCRAVRDGRCKVYG